MKFDYKYQYKLFDKFKCNDYFISCNHILLLGLPPSESLCVHIVNKFKVLNPIP